MQVSLQALDLIGELFIALFRIGKVLLSDCELTLELNYVGRELLLRQKVWRERLLSQVRGQDRERVLGVQILDPVL